MDPERERRLNEILCEAVALPSESRSAYLDEACTGDAELLAEAREILDLEEDLGGFLERPALAGVSGMSSSGVARGESFEADSWSAQSSGEAREPALRPLADIGDSLVGTRVRNIRITGLIGRGGMGELYSGVDEHLQREVALKAIRRPQLRSPRTRQLFLREARLLSQIDHPNICRIYDHIETPEGDFLVLELIHGQTLEEAWDGGFDRPTQLRLAEQIARALAAAHSHGVVHRDLKPSNIMVTHAGQIKVLDFGVARPLGAGDDAGDGTPEVGRRTLEEAAQELAGKQADASSADPEATWRMANGGLVGTLGYMSPEQARGETADASSDVYSLGLVLRELFTGDAAFDRSSNTAVLLTDMAEARLEPLEGLEPDLKALLERALAAEPSARPSATELAQHLEWIRDQPKRRLRRALVITAVLLLVLAGLKYTLDLRRHNQELERQRQAADTARNEAEQVTNFLVELFEISDPSASRGAQVTARELLDEGAAKTRRELAEQPLVRARLLDTIGRVYDKLGLPGTGEELIEEALALRRQHAAGPVELVESLINLNAILRDRGEHEQALALLIEAEAVSTERAPEDEALVAEVYNDRAILYLEMDEADLARPYYERALEIRERVLPPDSHEIATSLNNMGVYYTEIGEYALAAEHLLRAIDLRERIQGADHPDLAHSLNNLAIVYYRLGRVDEVLPLFERDLQISVKTLGPDHPDVALTHSNMGTLASRLERHGEAADHYAEAARIYELRYGEEDPALGAALGGLGWSLVESGEEERGLALLRRGLELSMRLRPSHRATAGVAMRLGQVLHRLGELKEAREAVAQAVAIYRTRADPEDPELLKAAEELARIEGTLAGQG